MSAWIFENCRLFDGVSRDIRDGVHVLVEGEAIAAVEERAIAGATARRIDASGRLLMPGLIDAHVHAIAATANLGLLDAMPGTYLGTFAKRFLEASLDRGFTTVRDAGGADHGIAAALKSGLVAGPRLYYSGKVLSQTGGHGDFRGADERLDVCPCCQGSSVFAHIVDGADAVRAAARDELRKGATQIKIMASGGVASPSDPIWAPQFSLAEIDAAVEEAGARRTYVMAHAYTAGAIGRCLDRGVRSIEHGNLIDRDAAAAVVAHDAYVVPTLATYDCLAEFGAAQGFPPESVAKIADVRSAGRKAIGTLRDAGAKLGFGTDLLGDMHVHQGREFRLRAAVEDPIDTLISATSVNAALLNETGRLGCVAPGALADLLLVDGDPLADVNLFDRQGGALDVIMKGGAAHKLRLPA